MKNIVTFTDTKTGKIVLTMETTENIVRNLFVNQAHKMWRLYVAVELNKMFGNDIAINSKITLNSEELDNVVQIESEPAHDRDEGHDDDLTTFQDGVRLVDGAETREVRASSLCCEEDGESSRRPRED